MILHQADSVHDGEPSVIYLDDVNATLDTLSRPDACTICKYAWSMFTTSMSSLSEDAVKASIIRHAVSTTPLEYDLVPT
jgi:hypothetical protein